MRRMGRSIERGEWYSRLVVRQAGSHPIAARLATVAIVTLLAGCGSPPAPTAAPATPTSSASASPSTSASPSSSPTGSPSPSPSLAGDLSIRPFTVLVLGGDNDFRTDATMVVGIDPVNKKISLASIPRDTANVPLPDGGTFTNMKINAFYDFARKHSSRYPQGPGRATADLVGKMLGIHIDFYAATSFDGFVNLVTAMNGVRVTLAKAVVDPFYQVTTRKFGVRFPAGAQTLKGDRALIFVRTRQGDNDFERERRHQLFLLAAGRQLLAHPSLLALLLAAHRNLITDFPLDQVPGLVTAMSSAGKWPVQQVVLGPRKYESAMTCTCGYALKPRLDQMRATAMAFFPWAVAH